MIFLFSWVILRFHVEFQGCTMPKLCIMEYEMLNTQFEQPTLYFQECLLCILRSQLEKTQKLG